MKRELIEKAIGNISEQYKDEALEYQCKATVSDINGMNVKKSRRFVTVGIAAALIAAFGATAYASDLFKITKRDPEPQETIQITYEIEDTDGVEQGFYEYNHLTKIIEAEGLSEANEIEIRLKNPLEGFAFDMTGDPTNWRNLIQGESEDGFFNVEIFYMPLFASDGGLFMQDDILTEEEFIGEDGFQHYKVSSAAYGLSVPYNFYHFIFDEQSGYVIVAVSSISEEFTDNLLNNVEIRETGNIVKADSPEYSDYNYYVCNGLG